MTIADTLDPVPKAKIAITLDAELVRVIKRLVAAGRADSVSAYIEDAVAEYVSDDGSAFDALLDEMLEETGGPLTAEEIADIDRRFGWD